MTALATDEPLHLRPALSPQMQRVLSEERLIAQLADGFGSPLNIVLPETLHDNVVTCKGVLEEFDLQSRVFLAHKPNRSKAMISKAATIHDLGLDVASEGELRNGLCNGFPGSSIEATGPKNARYLRLALQHGVLINVDNMAELIQITAMHKALGLLRPASVVIRLNGLLDDGRRSDTKFGLATRDITPVLEWLINHRSTVGFLGFAFHLTFSTARERARAVESVISHHVAALRVGLSPSVINIGGGFKVNFLDNAEGWERYVSALKAGLVGESDPLSWNGATFGIAVDHGRISGSANLTSFHREDTLASELDAFLQTPLASQNGRKVADFLAENLIELHLEPGRAMFDQCGLTVARANFVKQSEQGETLVGLDMNRSNLDASDREFFADPVVIHRAASEERESASVYFSGNLCLPGDMITRHRTWLSQLPDVGDLVVFPNTAGYFMDFIESETLLQRTAPKVAVSFSNEVVHWSRDEDYDPLPEWARQ